jgi:hypothetical protein
MEIVMKRIKLLILPLLLLIGCSNDKSNSEIDDKSNSEIAYKVAVETQTLIVATEKYELEYFNINSELIKYDENIDTRYYKVIYICYDDNYNYYEYRYLVAINNETIQVKELVCK